MDKENKASRRDFLKLAGTAAPVAAVAVATTTGTEAEAATVDLSSTRLQDTVHVRTAYETARF